MDRFNSSGYGQNPENNWSGLSSQQNESSGQFDIWRPSAPGGSQTSNMANYSNQNMPTTTAANFSTNSGNVSSYSMSSYSTGNPSNDESWKYNRENAINEAYQSMNNPSISANLRSITENQDPSQYSLSSQARPTFTQASSVQSNQYYNSGTSMTSNMGQPQRYHNQQQPTFQSSQQQQTYSQQQQQQSYTQQQQQAYQSLQQSRSYQSQAQPYQSQLQAQTYQQQPQTYQSQQQPQAYQSQPQPQAYQSQQQPQAYKSQQQSQRYQSQYHSQQYQSQQQQPYQMPATYNQQQPSSAQQQPNQMQQWQPPNVGNYRSDSPSQPTRQSFATNEASSNASQLNSSSWSTAGPISQASSTRESAYDKWSSSGNDSEPLQNASPIVYSNPLHNSNDPDDETAEALVSRMHDSANREREKLNGTQKYPTTFSKGALALLQRDLKEAAAPFETAETLKKFRNLQLGIGTDESEVGRTPSPVIVSSTNLSVNAVEFVPRSNVATAAKTEKAALRERKSSSGSLQFEMVSPLKVKERKLPSPFKDYSKKPSRAKVDRKSKYTKSQTFNDSNLDIDDPLADMNDFCWNPLDGPVMYKNSPKKTPCTSISLSKNNAAVRKLASNFSNAKTSSSKTKSVKTPTKVTEKKSLAVRIPWLDDPSASKDIVLPLLGIMPLSELGFWSEVDVAHTLMKKVSQVQDLPVNSVPEDEIDTVKELEALDITDDFINALIFTPACYDNSIADFLSTLRSYQLSVSAVTVIAEKIYEMCVLEPNFRYLGSQLCDRLANKETGLELFRKCLLNKAQREFMAMDEDLSDTSPEKTKRARNFTQFVAELFLNLKLEQKNNSSTRFAVLGRGTFGVVRKLVDHPNDDNLQCAIRVLKLTITALEDSLENDGKGSMEKLKDIIDDLEAIYDKTKYPDLELKELTLKLLSGFIKLRQQNWGRMSRSTSESSTSKPPVLPEHDENYFMNEPVFFTPSGQQYTAADAADPEFYRKHLAPYSAAFQPAPDVTHEPSYYGTKPTDSGFTRNPMDAGENSTTDDVLYPIWSSAGEQPDQFDQVSAEDDYDADLEAFLLSTGQS